MNEKIILGTEMYDFAFDVQMNEIFSHDFPHIQTHTSTLQCTLQQYGFIRVSYFKPIHSLDVCLVSRKNEKRK